MRILSCMFLFLLFFISGCSIQDESDAENREIHSSVEWADVVKWQEGTYYLDEDKTNGITEEDVGEVLGEVSFRVMYSEAENNPDYQLSNGEATWLEEGTAIHAITGESSKKYIFADGKVYKSEE